MLSTNAAYSMQVELLGYLFVFIFDLFISCSNQTLAHGKATA